MSEIQWSDQLLLDFEPMDQVHREFIDLLAQVEQAPDDHLEEAWTAMLGHTTEHFGREDTWMRKTNYGSAANHIMQHRVVLNVLREGLDMIRSRSFEPARTMARELAAWFAKHTQSLDAALAQHLRSTQADLKTLAA
ncbi:hemerythrin domain-containing protein [Hydrogenophaga sp. 5NK40-0174]|uniref:bacteriohemerythrin n=1 Tax=Hydrogenophaga sp. 5NK40-0174 TaxID=3127649 RepID=UPI003108FF42